MFAFLSVEEEKEKQVQMLEAMLVEKEELVKKNNLLSKTENELREAVLANETEYSERLQLARITERELTEKFNRLNEQFNALKEQLTSANDENLVLRSTVVASPKICKEQPTLENEIQSWRSVLEMKRKEISDLQKRNLDLENSAAALPGALAKISSLESRLEDLQIQLKIKTEEEQ